MKETESFLNLQNKRLAYQQLLPCKEKENCASLFFLGGYASDMNGTKASFLAEKCRENGLGMLRFDYRGHGKSSGELVEGTLGDWFEDSLDIFDHLARGPQLLVGSSMGGWIALLLALKRPSRMAGLIGIAAAPDFTEELILPSLTFEKKIQLQDKGMIFDETAPPDRQVPITRRFLEEARNHLVMDKVMNFPFPIRLLQGQKDEEVPWRFALKIMEHINSPSVHLTLVKDGDHSLSRSQDLSLLWRSIEGVPL